MRAVALLLAGLLAASCKRAPPRPFPAELPPFTPGSQFIAAGDLQRTPFFERRESNDAERVRLVQAIAAARPSFVAFTGDLVDEGSSASDWSDFDRLTAPIRDAGIPAIVAIGNHEYERSREGEQHVLARFPAMKGRHHDVVDRGPLRLVLLDSNDLVLSKEEWAEQRRWYDETLARLDADGAVRGVMVLLHHEPFTNSTMTADEGQVQRDFLPGFLAAKKTLAMLSGHVHSYERFTRQGKTFVVSGGGGGPRITLAVGSARRHPDDLFDGPPVRDFHFIVYTIGDGSVEAEVRSLPKGGTAFSTMDRFSLPYPR